MSEGALGGVPAYQQTPFSGESARLNEIKFLGNVMHLVQQKEDQTRGMFPSMPGGKSEMVRFEFLAPHEAQEMTEPYPVVFPGSDYGSSVTGDITPSKGVFSERWVFIRRIFDLMFSRKDSDVLSQIDVNGSLSKSMAYALNRKRASILLEAAIGNVYTGPQNNLSIVAFPDSQIIQAADQGLTYDKLVEAKFRMDDSDDIPDEDRYAFVTAEQIQNCYNMMEIKHRDYNAMQDLVNGKVSKFLGFEFKRVSKSVLPKTDHGDGTYTRKCIFCHKDGIGRVVWDESMTDAKIEQLAHLLYNYQLFATEAYNCIRLQEEFVVEVDCKEVLTPARD